MCCAHPTLCRSFPFPTDAVPTSLATSWCFSLRLFCCVHSHAHLFPCSCLAMPMCSQPSAVPYKLRSYISHTHAMLVRRQPLGAQQPRLPALQASDSRPSAAAAAVPAPGRRPGRRLALTAHMGHTGRQKRQVGRRGRSRGSRGLCRSRGSPHRRCMHHHGMTMSAEHLNPRQKC